MDEDELREEFGELRADIERASIDESRWSRGPPPAAVFDLGGQLQTLRTRLACPVSASVALTGDEPSWRPMFDRLDDWVNNWLIPVYVPCRSRAARSDVVPAVVASPGGVRAAWTRCGASWEYHRLKPGTGTAVFMQRLPDHHMAC